jgi:hypothetical protein
MPHVIERATSGRATCRGCGAKIARDELRFGERLPNPFADEGGEMTHWFHVACAAFTRPEAFLEAAAALDEPERAAAGTDGGSDALVLADRARLEREAHLGIAHRRVPRIRAASRAPSGRATCRACRQTIDKGGWRLALQYYEDGRFVPSGFIHVGCARPYLETTDIIDRVRHFSPDLSETDIAEIGAELSA